MDRHSINSVTQQGRVLRAGNGSPPSQQPLPRSGLVLLSQKVAAFADENHVFGKIQFQHAGG